MSRSSPAARPKTLRSRRYPAAGRSGMPASVRCSQLCNHVLVFPMTAGAFRAVVGAVRARTGCSEDSYAPNPDFSCRRCIDCGSPPRPRWPRASRTRAKRMCPQHRHRRQPPTRRSEPPTTVSDERRKRRVGKAQYRRHARATRRHRVARQHRRGWRNVWIYRAHDRHGHRHYEYVRRKFGGYFASARDCGCRARGASAASPLAYVSADDRWSRGHRGHHSKRHRLLR